MSPSSCSCKVVSFFVSFAVSRWTGEQAFCSPQADRFASNRLVRVFNDARGGCGHILPELFPWEIEPPVGACQGKGKRGPKARGRRPRPRICLRKGCRRKYQPRCHNQRYCQDPECLREVRHWLAARRQGKRRQDADVRSKRAQDEKARRQRVKSASQTIESPELAPRVVTQLKLFFSLPLCDRPGCHEHPASPPLRS